MTVPSIANSVRTHLPEINTQRIGDNVKNVANKVKDFVLNNKALMAFAASSIFVLAATPGALAGLAIARTLAGGLASGILVHLVTKLVTSGRSGFDSPSFQRTALAISAFTQVILWGFNPLGAVAATVSNLGFHTTGYAVRAFHNITES